MEGLYCRYKREPPVFQNLSFSARPGVLAITGDNGVGKSTLSRCLCGLMRESAGTIRLNGRVLGPKQRRRIPAASCRM
ncbi:MAG: ATP-binding cassette domain-containing protein [Dysosmobacter welbionis]